MKGTLELNRMHMKKLLVICLFFILSFVACTSNEKKITKYYDSGNVRREYWIDSRLIGNGPSINYYNDGTVQSMSFLLNGEINGKAVGYYENRKLKYLIEYKNNKYTNFLYSFYPSGKIESIQYYTDGDIVYSKKYNENGILIDSHGHLPVSMMGDSKQTNPKK
jgi:antitoxin component YwqK of YwqJK toxin-antitoxin module